MRTIPNIGLAQVQGVYSGAEGELWRLIMGHQVHLGGMESSQDLASRAQIQKGSSGVDFCCCLGGGMRFLVRFHGVGHMTGVDATPKMVEEGRRLCAQEGLADRITFVEGDVTASGLPSASADFVWGEDAWCYVEDKEKMIAEAVRIVRPGGTIAFTDWVEGPKEMSPAEAMRFLSFMKFPNIADIGCYTQMLGAHGCTVLEARDTGRFAPCVDLYLNMLQRQLTYDALRVLGFDQQFLEQWVAELSFAQELAWIGKVVQGMFVARKQ